MDKTEDKENIMRRMHRLNQTLSPKDIDMYLKEENWGVLSVHGDNGFPYGVPMNYVWSDGTIILHATANESHRLDALRRDNKVCFTVVPEHVLDGDHWSEKYVSIVIFGTAEIISQPQERLEAMRTFMGLLAPISWMKL